MASPWDMSFNTCRCVWHQPTRVGWSPCSLDSRVRNGPSSGKLALPKSQQNHQVAIPDEGVAVKRPASAHDAKLDSVARPGAVAGTGTVRFPKPSSRTRLDVVTTLHRVIDTVGCKYSCSNKARPVCQTS